MRITELDKPEFGAAEEADEFVRFWVADGEEHVSLRIGAFDPETEAEAWGMVAADIIAHAVRGMCQDDAAHDPDILTAQAERAFVERLASKVNLTGQLRGKHNQ